MGKAIHTLASQDTRSSLPEPKGEDNLQSVGWKPGLLTVDLLRLLCPQSGASPL